MVVDTAVGLHQQCWGQPVLVVSAPQNSDLELGGICSSIVHRRTHPNTHPHRSIPCCWGTIFVSSRSFIGGGGVLTPDSCVHYSVQKRIGSCCWHTDPNKKSRVCSVQLHHHQQFASSQAPHTQPHTSFPSTSECCECHSSLSFSGRCNRREVCLTSDSVLRNTAAGPTSKKKKKRQKKAAYTFIKFNDGQSHLY